MADCINEKIDSNVTELRIAEEECLRELGDAPVWVPRDPNSYGSFGATFNRITRAPISRGRQRRKGKIVGLDSDAAFNADLTASALREDLQGFMFADLRVKGVSRASEVTPSGVTLVNGDAIPVGSLVALSGFAATSNRGLRTVTTNAAGVVSVSGTLVAEPNPPAGAAVSVVGAVAGAVSVVTPAGGYPRLVSESFDFTTLGLVPGEWVCVGGDAAGTYFADAMNNGFKRVRSVRADELVFDKSHGVMKAEGEVASLHIYTGHHLRNETGNLIKRRTYQLERALGSLDGLEPGQYEYITGAVPNEFNVSLTEEDKITADLSYVGTGYETRTQAEGPKEGARPALIDEDVYNTTSDVVAMNLTILNPGDASPSPLFGYATDVSIGISNGVTRNKAIGVMGAFDATAGDFVVTGNVTAYFSDIAAVRAIERNADVSFDMALVLDNKGVIFDIPLLSLGDGRINVTKDEPIMLPVSLEAGSGAKIDSALNYTLGLQFFDYLPMRATA